MLQPKLTTEPAENIRGAYVKEGEVWILDKLADDHPKMVENKRLIDEKRAVETERDTFKTSAVNLERERDEFKNKAVPSGYRTVPKADAELLDAIKPLNLSKDELATLKTENEQFKTEKAVEAEKTSKTKAFEFAGVKSPASALKLAAANDLKIEWKEINGKQTPFNVGEKDGQKTETLIDDKFIRETEGFSEFAPSLFAESADKGRSYIGMESGLGGGEAKSVADSYINQTYKRPDKKD